MHVAVHTLTPVMDGEVRNADVGVLYESKRVRERDFVRLWGRLLHDHAPELRVRYNYPYLIMSWL